MVDQFQPLNEALLFVTTDKHTRRFKIPEGKLGDAGTESCLLPYSECPQMGGVPVYYFLQCFAMSEVFTETLAGTMAHGSVM